MEKLAGISEVRILLLVHSKVQLLVVVLKMPLISIAFLDDLSNFTQKKSHFPKCHCYLVVNIEVNILKILPRI